MLTHTYIIYICSLFTDKAHGLLIVCEKGVFFIFVSLLFSYTINFSFSFILHYYIAKMNIDTISVFKACEDKIQLHWLQ